MRVTSDNVVTNRLRAGIVSDRLVPVARTVNVTFATREDGLTRIADAPAWNSKKSVETAPVVAPSKCRMSTVPLARKIPRPVADASASIHPSKD